MGLDAMILVFWMLSFKPTFLLPSFIYLASILVFPLDTVFQHSGHQQPDPDAFGITTQVQHPRLQLSKNRAQTLCLV